MNISKIVNMWKMMSKYPFEEDGITNDDNLMCLLCKKLMIDACQTTCGCRFCYKCICDYLVDSDKRCPGGNIMCKGPDLSLELDVMKNTRLNNSICKLRVRCPNEWCQFTIELKEMVDHLVICVKEATQCLYVDIGCDLQHHDNSDGSSHTLLLVGCINNLKNEVDSLKEALEQKNVQCEEMVKVKMEQAKEIIDLAAEIQNKENRIVNLEGQLTGMKTQIDGIIDDVVMNQMEKREDVRINLLQIEVKRILEQNAGIIKDVDEMRNGCSEMRNMERRMIQYINYEELCPNGEFDFVWKINGISRKRMAPNGTKMFSDLFYSMGYNFCLSVFMKKNRVALWCYLNKGDNDDDLEWPMDHKVTLSILNQESVETHLCRSYQFNSYNPKYETAFYRPRSGRNRNSIGSYILCQYNNIANFPGVIVDDSIVVACSVEENSYSEDSAKTENYQSDYDM